MNHKIWMREAVADIFNICKDDILNKKFISEYCLMMLGMKNRKEFPFETYGFFFKCLDDELKRLLKSKKIQSVSKSNYINSDSKKAKMLAMKEIPMLGPLEW